MSKRPLVGKNLQVNPGKKTMWGNIKKPKTAKIETLVGANTQIMGDITFKGGLHIEGLIKGNVTSTGDEHALLVLSENGKIEGQVNVPNVTVNGMVVGDIHAPKMLELASSAKVHGTIYYTLLETSLGAEINGQMVQHTDVKANKDEKVSSESLSVVTPAPETATLEMGERLRKH